VCGRKLQLETIYFGHEGVYRCTESHFARPRPEVAATNVRLEQLKALQFDVDGRTLRLGFGGLYNAYNLLAAYSAGLALGLEPQYLAEQMARVEAAFGRLERFEAGGRRLTLVLAKNPVGFNEALRGTVELAQARRLLIAINDRIADGRDVSWLWDVDFEMLAGHAETVVVSGTRAHDMAVRLKYAGLDGFATEPDLDRALDRLLTTAPGDEDAYALCTYTAMLDLRAVLVRRGWARPYWLT
jgi:UDP-N-acetylmuramyl tripeptide synthase